MKIKLTLLLLLALWIQPFGNTLYSQTLSFSGPTTVNSGDIVTFTVLNETASNYIGSVPLSAWTDLAGPVADGSVTCVLYETNYFDASNPTVPGRFKYTLKNTYPVAKTVTLTFANLTIADSTVPSTSGGEITYTITVNPAPPATTYYSDAMSGSFVKNNCANSGGPGPAVIYTMPSGEYTSTVSQADANQQAANNFNARGQQYANVNGTCYAPFSLIIVSGNTPVNGNYPRNTRITASMRSTSDTPPGSTFQIVVNRPGGTSSTYNSSSATFSLSSLGQYIIQAKVINSVGAVVQELNEFIYAGN